MQKIGILATKVTPCEICGDPSTTMVGGVYLCEKHGTEASEKMLKEGSGIPSPFRSSMRQIIEELSK